MRFKLLSTLLLVSVVVHSQTMPSYRRALSGMYNPNTQVTTYYSFKVMPNGSLGFDTAFQTMDGTRFKITQDTLHFPKYNGRNDGMISNIAHFNGGYLRVSPVSQLTLPYTQISGRPSLATVATSGSYNDLVNKPSLFSGAYADLTGKPTLFSGSYTDLTNKPTIPTMFADSVQYYNSSGRIYNKIKKWVGRIAVTNANGQSVDFSSCGCSSVLSIVATAEKNGTTSTASPNVAIKSYTTSAVTFNFTEANAAVVSILGINVLSGLPLIFATTTGLFVHVEITCI